MKVLRNLILIILSTLIVDNAYAQCENWTDSPQKETAENAHVLYRQFVKGKQAADLVKLDDESFNIAVDNWKTAYEIAPAADGQRPSHYADGRKIYMALAMKADDDTKKTEYYDMVLKLYDQQMECYKNEAYLLGRKAYDMFTMPHHGYRTSTLETFKAALETGGNASEYIILEPMAQLMAYLFKTNQITQEETQKLYEKMEGIADYNTENNKNYGEYYTASKARMQSQMEEVASDVFDCDYFKKNLVPLYKEKPEDLETLKYVFVTLSREGCDTTEAIMVEIKKQYESVAAEINAGLEEERRQNNPCYDATQLQKEGKYEEAMARYKECLASSDNIDNDGKAQVYYSMAFIQTWQFGQYSTARENARKAASLKPGWGKPYILIGDMYGKTSRSCGDDWGARMAVLAAIEKYAYAKSIDSSVAEDANKRIGQYAAARPDKQEGFMRGVKAGQTAKVPCWIGETVKVRFKD